MKEMMTSVFTIKLRLFVRRPAQKTIDKDKTGIK